MMCLQNWPKLNFLWKLYGVKLAFGRRCSRACKKEEDDAGEEFLIGRFVISYAGRAKLLDAMGRRRQKRKINSGVTKRETK